MSEVKGQSGQGPTGASAFYSGHRSWEVVTDSQSRTALDRAQLRPHTL